MGRACISWIVHYEELIEALFLEKIRRKETYESLEQLIINQVTEATMEAEDSLGSTESKEDLTDEEKAERALDSLEELDELLKE